MEFSEHIRIDADGTATYAREAVIPAQNGMPERRRVLQTKRVDARAVLPNRGAIVVLPPNGRCVWSDEEGRNMILVVEDPPAVRTVRWVTQTLEFEDVRRRLMDTAAWHRFGCTRAEFTTRLQTQRAFALAFPYVVRCYHFTDGAYVGGWVWYRTAPLTDERSELLIANVPNQGTDGRICSTPYAHNRVCTGALATDAAELDREFWGGVWNDHWLHRFRETGAQIPAVASPWEWELASREDPLCVLSAPWISSEQTIADAVRTRLADAGEDGADADDGADAAAATFALMCRRVQAADAWAHHPAVVRGVAMSPASYLSLEDADGRAFLLRVGDALTFTKPIFDVVAAGVPYAIAAFGRADFEGNRFVQLAGVGAPLTLIVGGALLETCVVAAAAEPVPDVPIVLDGVTVEPGCRLRATHREEWPKPFERWRTVATVERDHRGCVLAMFSDDPVGALPTVIGMGDAFAPGLAVRPKEEVGTDGYCTAREIALTDGTTVRIGDRLLWYGERGRDTAMLCTVRAFSPMGADGRRYCADLLLCRDDDALTDGVARVTSVAPIVQVGATTIRVGDRVRVAGANWYCIMAIAVSDRAEVFVVASSTLWYARVATDGALRADVAFRHEPVLQPHGCHHGSAWHPNGQWFADAEARRVRKAIGYVPVVGGVDIRLADGDVLPFIRNGERCGRWTPAAVRHRVAGATRAIHRGLRVRLRYDVPGAPAGTVLAVSHVRRAPTESPTTIVFDDGRACAATLGNLACFEAFDRGAWAPLVPGDVPASGPVPGEGIAVGVRVRYLGGDSDTSRGFDGEAIGGTAVVRTPDPMKKDHWLCEFDRDLVHGHRGDGHCAPMRGQWIRGRYLVRADGPMTSGLRSDLRARGFTAGTAAVRLVEPGRVVGRDARGVAVRIGDRVRVTTGALASDATPVVRDRVRALVARGHAFTVVHYGVRSSKEELTWLYLDAGEDLGQEPRGDVVGLRGIPEVYSRDPAWWSRIAWVRLNGCERVE